GNASGAGIMIVEGNLTIQGNFHFNGLIIVRGTTQVTEVTGNATVYGSIWTEDIQLEVSGSALVNYSSQALALANLVSGGAGLPETGAGSACDGRGASPLTGRMLRTRAR